MLFAGHTFEEARKNIEEAIRLYLDDADEDTKAYLRPRSEDRDCPRSPRCPEGNVPQYPPPRTNLTRRVLATPEVEDEESATPRWAGPGNEKRPAEDSLE